MARKEGAELIIRCREVADFTEQAAKDNDLLRALSDLGERLVDGSSRVPIYAFKHRFKGHKNILKKVERKRAEGARMLAALQPLLAAQEAKQKRRVKLSPALGKLRAEVKEATLLRDYDPHHVTDALGGRYVALYQTEIPLIVGSLLSCLHTFNASVAGVAGAAVRLREFVIYTNRPPKDPLSIVEATQQALKKSNFASTTSVIRPPENRKSAYSSVHLVFDRYVEIEHAGRSIAATELASFEVQIRDIFEEGWGEVQHHMLYSQKDHASNPDGGENGPDAQWRLHLNALKTFVDGCSQHASIIRMHYDNAVRNESVETAIRSVTEREKDKTNIIQTLKRLREAPESAQEAVADAYVLFESGEQATSPTQKIDRFLESSKKFERALSALSKALKREEVQNSHGRTIEYYLTMEKGNCKVAAAEAVAVAPTPDKDQQKKLLDEARTLFTLMIEMFPADPVAHSRRGKALEKSVDDPAALEESLKMYRQAAKLIAGDPVTGPNHWLAVLSHVNISYVLWLLANIEKDESRIRKLLIEAAHENLLALAMWRKQSESARFCEINRLHAHKAASNVLYFCGRLIIGGYKDETVNRQTLYEHIDIINDLNVEVYADYYKTRDNLIHAYVALGEIPKAKALAAINFRELRDAAEQRNLGVPLDVDAVRDHLRGPEVNCFAAARAVLFSRLDGDTPVG